MQDFYRRPEGFSTQGVNQTLIYPGLADVESLRLQYDLGPGPWQTYISYVPAQTEDGKNVTHPSNAQALPLHHTVSKRDTFETFSLWVRAEKLIRGSNNMLFPQELSIGTNVAWKKNQGDISIDVFGYQNHDFISQDGINYSSNANKVSGSYNDVRAEVKDNHVYTYNNNPLPLNCNAYYRMSTYWGEPLPSTATVTSIPEDPFHALVNMDFGYTDNVDPEPSLAQRGSSFCNVKSGVGGSDKVTVKMNITVKMDYTPQYRCEKNGSEWYYDNFVEIPNKFAVSDYVCIPCAADEKRDPNNPGQCVKACAAGLTSNDHGATCQTEKLQIYLYGSMQQPDGSSLNIGFDCPEGYEIEAREGQYPVCSGGRRLISPTQFSPFSEEGGFNTLDFSQSQAPICQEDQQ